MDDSRGPAKPRVEQERSKFSIVVCPMDACITFQKPEAQARETRAANSLASLHDASAVSSDSLRGFFRSPGVYAWENSALKKDCPFRGAAPEGANG